MSDKSSTSLSVAIVCYHSSVTELQALLSSLLLSLRDLKQHIDLPETVVYLIDNTEHQELLLPNFDNLAQAMKSAHVELRLLQGHGNIGYGSAHNLVLTELQSELHLLLNPDVVLEQDSLHAGIQYLLNNPDVAIVSPSAIDAHGNKQYLCKTFPAVFTLLVRGFVPAFIKSLFTARLMRYEMRRLSEEQPSNNIPIVSGCCMLCRTDKLKRVQGFDEDYFLYFEDFDLSLRMHAEGDIVYVPTMRIRHGGGNAARKGFEHLKMFGRSAVQFYNTHGWHWLRQD